MGKNNFPTFDEFSLYLSDEKDVVFNSGLKSRFLFIIKYFADKDFTRDNFRIMLNKLRTTTELRPIPLKKSTLNKYVQMARRIARMTGNHEFDDFDGYRLRDEDTKPLGDLITDKEARQLAEVKMKYHKRSDTQIEEINAKYRAALTMMRFVGTPPVDMTNMKWQNDKITHFDYYRHKTHKHMIVPIVPLLRKYLDVLPRSNKYIFGSAQGQMSEKTLRKEIVRRVVKLGMKKNVTCYSFRYMATAFSYMNSKDNNITHLADIFGHTVDVAKTHYNLVRDPQILLDALMTSHPGLMRDSSIDSIKRIALDFLSRLIDASKFEVELTIRPKLANMRHIRIS